MFAFIYCGSFCIFDSRRSLHATKRMRATFQFNRQMASTFFFSFNSFSHIIRFLEEARMKWTTNIKMGLMLSSEILFVFQFHLMKIERNKRKMIILILFHTRGDSFGTIKRYEILRWICAIRSVLRTNSQYTEILYSLSRIP